MTVSIGNFAYSICQEFKETTTQVEKERGELFSKKPIFQRIGYYVLTTLALGSLVSTVGCLTFAAIEASTGFLLVAAVSAAAMVVFTYLREHFNTFTDAEELCKTRFLNPLGIDKNKNKLPEASSLKGHREYFEALVAPPHNEKAKIEQDNGLKAVYTLFDKKIDQKDVKEKISSLVVTSLLLEAIQHVYAKHEAESKDTAHRAEKLLDQTNFPNKEGLRKLAGHLKEPSKEFKEKVAVTISGDFRMSDLDDLIKE